MADLKISQLPVAVTPLDGDELVELVQDGVNVRTTTASIGLPFARTAGEVSALVTPFDERYEEGDDRRYASLTDFLAVVSVGVPGIMRKDYSISAPVTVTGDGTITFVGKRTITAAASMTHMLRATGEISIAGNGELLFDGDNKVTVACMQSTMKIPRLKNIRFLDAAGGLITGATLTPLSYGVTGDGEFDNVTCENCADIGLQAWGNQILAAQTATLVVRDCKTKGTTGSGNFEGTGTGYMHHFAGLLSVRIIGGHFRGDPMGWLTSAYKCSRAEVQGGTYDGIGRGPTIGEESVNFVVDGTVCLNLSNNAVSADTTTGVGSIPGIGVLSNNVAVNCARAIRSTCSNLNVTGNYAYECTSGGAAFAFGGTGDNIFVDGNSDFSATTSRVSFYVLENSKVRFGKNTTNATARQAYMVDAGSEGFFSGAGGGIVRAMTASGDLTGNDRIITCDATAGAIDLDLFDTTETALTGFEFTLVKLDAVNNLSVTFQGGGGGGQTINGASSMSVPNTQKARILFTCLNGPAGTWVTSIQPQGAYTDTGSPATDRTFNSDTVAVAELADVVSTLLADLGFR